MKFFSGFALQNESELFNFWLKNANNFTVAGFSAGAIEAVEYTLNSNERVDKLILLSPAFFNDKDKKFKRLQLLSFKKDKDAYLDKFYKNIMDSSDIDLSLYKREANYQELEKLLNYGWEESKIKKTLDKGIVIEVVLAGNDKIIDSKKALDFFKNLTTSYFIKDGNHLLFI